MPRYAFRVDVQPRFLPDQSAPDQHVWTFAYTITITNTGEVPAQLIARHWIITDERGKTEEVRGLAVVGHQPLLKPGEKFEYTSWTRLRTPQGTMRGTFFCMTEDARAFDAPVAEFMLAQRAALH